MNKPTAIRYAIAAAVAMALVSLPLAGSQRVDTEETRVLRVVQEVFDYLAERDSEAMKTLFWPGAVLVSDRPGPDGDRRQGFTPVEEWAESLAGAASDRVIERVVDPEVRIDDNIAAVWTDYTLEAGDYAADGVDAFHLVKQDGVWKIISLIYTHNPKD